MANRNTFVKVFTDLDDHPAWLTLDPEHVGLWLLALLYCRRNLTDGHFPEKLVRRWGGSDEALAALVAAGRWHDHEHGCDACPEVPAGALYLHGYLDAQNSKSDVEALSAKRSVAGAKGGKARPAVQSPDLQVKQDTEQLAKPTPSNAQAEGEREGEGENSRPRKRATQLPANFAPNDANQRIAVERGLDLAAVVAQWSDYHRAKGSTFKDWHAALNTWLRREQPTLPVQSQQSQRVTLNLCDGTACPGSRHRWDDKHGNAYLCSGVTA